jgi:hypothetical protein
MRWLLPLLLLSCSNAGDANANAEADASAADSNASADTSAPAADTYVASDTTTPVADTSVPPSDVAIDAPASDLDPDGVKMLQPTKVGGLWWRLGTNDPNTAKDFEIEQGDTATKKTSGGLTFWNLPSHSLAYASGGTGWTTRLHIYASGTTTQLYTWKTQKGWLATPKDIKDQEFTVYVRPHTILDAPRAQMTLKIRGGKHSSSNASLGSCTMTTIGAPTSGGIARFGKELDHPTYDYVKLTPAVPAQLTDNVWLGLKLVSYQRPGETTKVQYRMFVDRTPFDATGKPANKWELFSTYEDVEGKDTGAYTKLVDWGGMITTFRTDGLKDIDFTLVSVREIVAPSS